MPNGWNKLGEALAGIHPARREEIRQQTLQGLARTDSSLAKARMDLEKAKHFSQDALGQYFIDIGSDDPVAAARAQAGVALSGVNYNGLQSGLAARQKMGFRQGAVDYATAGDLGRANAQLFGVASGPVEIPKVSGNMLLSNRLIPGGGDVTVTPIGQSQIRANDARAQASIINAKKPRAAGGGRSGAAPKMSEIDKLRLQSELKALEPQLQAALDEVARNQGATAGPGVRKLAEAQARVAEIQAAQQAIFDKYENAAGAPGGARARGRRSEVNGVAVPAGSSPDELGLLTAMNLEFDRTGQPRLTGDEVRGFRATGTVPRPAAADPVTPAEGAISNRLIDRFAESLTGYGGSPAPAPAAAAVARPANKAEYDRLPSGTRFIDPNGTTRIKP